jgi:hypothetical protein
MEKTKLHKWTLTARFRRNAFGWKGSRLACQRIKAAVSEIKKMARKDPLLGAEGAIKFMENCGRLCNVSILLPVPWEPLYTMQ